MPQSSRICFPPTITRWHEPVTSPAAPWNSISIARSQVLAARIMQRRGGCVPPRRALPCPGSRSIAVKADAEDQRGIQRQSHVAVHIQSNCDRLLEELVDDAVRQAIVLAERRIADRT